MGRTETEERSDSFPLPTQKSKKAKTPDTKFGQPETFVVCNRERMSQAVSFTQIDVFVACVAVVVVASLLCKAGKQIVSWLLYAAALFAIINVLLNVLLGGDKWGLATQDTLNRGSRRLEGGRLYETVVSSRTFALTANAVKDLRGVGEDEQPRETDDTPPKAEAESEVKVEAEGTDSGWRFPWA